MWKTSKEAKIYQLSYILKSRINTKYAIDNEYEKEITKSHNDASELY